MIRKCLWVAFTVHFTIVLMLCVHHLFWNEKPKKRMIVRTILQKTGVQPQKVVASRPKQTIAKAKPTRITSAKKTKEVADKPKPSVAPILKTKEVEAPILKLKSIDLPVPELKIKAEEPFQEIAHEELRPTYGQTLIAYLQSCLDLPEFGEVKVDLEIDRNGHLVHFEILEEKSKKNAEFLKKRLPELVLPCFNDMSNETAVFTITFKNSTRTIL